MISQALRVAAEGRRTERQIRAHTHRRDDESLAREDERLVLSDRRGVCGVQVVDADLILQAERPQRVPRGDCVRFLAEPARAPRRRPSQRKWDRVVTIAGSGGSGWRAHAKHTCA